MKSKIVGYIAVAAMTIGAIALGNGSTEAIFILGVVCMFIVARIDKP